MGTALVIAICFSTAPYAFGSLHSDNQYGSHSKQVEAQLSETLEQDVLAKQLSSEVQNLFDIMRKVSARAATVENQMKGMLQEQRSMTNEVAELENTLHQHQTNDQDLVVKLKSMQAEADQVLRFASMNKEAKHASETYILQSKIEQLQHVVDDQTDSGTLLAEATAEIADALADSEKSKLALLNTGKRPSDRAHPELSHLSFSKQPMVPADVAVASGTPATSLRTSAKKSVLAQVGSAEQGMPPTISKCTFALIEFLLGGLFGVDRMWAGEWILGLCKGITFLLLFSISAVIQCTSTLTFRTAFGGMMNGILIICSLTWFLLDYFGIFANMMTKAQHLGWLGYDVNFDPNTIDGGFSATLGLFIAWWVVIICTCIGLSIFTAPSPAGQQQQPLSQ